MERKDNFPVLPRVASQVNTDSEYRLQYYTHHIFLCPSIDVMGLMGTLQENKTNQPLKSRNANQGRTGSLLFLSWTPVASPLPGCVSLAEKNKKTRGHTTMLFVCGLSL